MNLSQPQQDLQTNGKLISKSFSKYWLEKQITIQKDSGGSIFPQKSYNFVLPFCFTAQLTQ